MLNYNLSSYNLYKNYEKETGKKPLGEEAKVPSRVAKDKDQFNFTDPESRIMKTSKGFDQLK